MNEHEDFWDLLPLAAAGGLDLGEERELRAHADGCRRCADELEALQELAGEVRKLPTPRPSAGLVESVRRQVHLELAGRADERLNQVLLVFLLLFSWTVTLAGYMVVRLLSGEPLALWSSLSTTGLRWSVIYFGFAWFGGAAAVVLLGLNYRRSSRLRRMV